PTLRDRVRPARQNPARPSLRPHGCRLIPRVPLPVGWAAAEPPCDRGRGRHALRQLERSDRGAGLAAARRRAEDEAANPVGGAEGRIRDGDTASGRSCLGRSAGARPPRPLAGTLHDGRARMTRALLLVAAAALVLSGCGSEQRQATPPKLHPGPTQHFRSRPDLRPPVVKIRVPARGTAPGYIFLGPKMAVAQAGPMIMDNR